QAILRPQFLFEICGLLHKQIQDAPVLLTLGNALFRTSAASKHAFENLAGIDLHWQRCSRRAPGKSVHVDAAVVAVARSDQARVVFSAEFERGQESVLTDLQCGELVGGYAGESV